MALKKSKKTWILFIIIVLVVPYLAVGTAVILKKVWWLEPEITAMAYLEAIRNREAGAIYLLSNMLGPSLSGMMKKSDMSQDQRKLLWAKDFTRWKLEFDKGLKSMDSLRRERLLICPGIQITQAQPAVYRAAVRDGQNENMVSYINVIGETYHVYYQLIFKDRSSAPTVSLLDNVRTGPERRIRSILVRVEVSLRPEIGPIKSTILKWNWLDKIAFIFPTGLFDSCTDPAAIWGAQLSFDVDKLTLETF
ncbi:MAG: hypothetical protein JRJ87_18020 [Deltaproteobacteria bacterium]|nr:hypothetical protein [Deltaproteobacteria bacterium]